MFRLLRHKLIVSYALIALVSLLLSGSAAAWLLQTRQEESAVRSLRILALSVSTRLPSLANDRQARLSQLMPRLRRQAEAAGVRLVVLSGAGEVLADTNPSQSLEGQRIPFVLREAKRAPAVHRRRILGQDLFFVLIPLVPPRMLAPERPHFIALVVPAADIVDTWLELAPSLLLALALTLVVCVAIGGLLSRAITRPIEEMTKASQAMAAGNYEQEINISTDDEVGRLAAAFNHMAHEVNQAHKTQRDFLANVSHDLKTPLTAIQGFSQALLDGSAASPEEQRRAAHIIHQEAERMANLVSELLELSRLESGQIPFKRDRLNVAEILHQCGERFRLQAEQANIELQVETSAADLSTVGDRDRLNQALANLVDNALRYTSPGGTVRLEGSVEATNHGLDRRWVVVRVSDTGQGISEQDLPRVFERFYRVDRARTAEGGTGLGLAITREIIHALGGQIAVRSEPGRGTTFTIRLPTQRSAGRTTA
jgi:signal transduction histidine kinase